MQTIKKKIKNSEEEKSAGEFVWEGQDGLDGAWERYRDREEFSYDPQRDPFYRQYAETYRHLGRLAMEDTVGVAAGLTGGYANSYAETAGQQAYNSYLQRLQDVLPELYGNAYERYQAEGESLYNEAVWLQQQKQQAYEEFLQQQKQENSQREENYDRLLVLLESGYAPTEEELAAAGMTARQAALLRGAMTAGDTGGSTGKSGGSGGLTAQQIRQMQEAINQNTGAGIAVDGIWGKESTAAAGGLSAEKAWEAYQNGTLFPQTPEQRNWADVEQDLIALTAAGASVKNKSKVLDEALRTGVITVSQYNTLYLRYCC